MLPPRRRNEALSILGLAGYLLWSGAACAQSRPGAALPSAAAVAAGPRDEALRRELLTRLEADQAAR